MSKLIYGQVVNITWKYVRRQRTAGNRGTYKYWDSRPADIKACIFLGTRTLKNGFRHYDSDYGYYFKPDEHFKVALVSPGKDSNPIYVPLDSI